MPMDARQRSSRPSSDFSSGGTNLSMTLGSEGFSTKSTIFASSPILSKPNPDASDKATGFTATVRLLPVPNARPPFLKNPFDKVGPPTRSRTSRQDRRESGSSSFVPHRQCLDTNRRHVRFVQPTEFRQNLSRIGQTDRHPVHACEGMPC